MTMTKKDILKIQYEVAQKYLEFYKITQQEYIHHDGNNLVIKYRDWECDRGHIDATGSICENTSYFTEYVHSKNHDYYPITIYGEVSDNGYRYVTIHYDKEKTHPKAYTITSLGQLIKRNPLNEGSFVECDVVYTGKYHVGSRCTKVHCQAWRDVNLAIILYMPNNSLDFATLCSQQPVRISGNIVNTLEPPGRIYIDWARIKRPCNKAIKPIPNHY